MVEREKIEKLSARAKVSNVDAENALTVCDGDLLDAMVYLERLGKVSAPENAVVTTSLEDHTTFENVQDKVDRYDRETARPVSSKIKHLFSIIIDTLKNNSLSVSQKGEEFIKLPLWVVALILIFAWHISIAIIIITLFFGVRYKLVGRDDMSQANKVIEKAADAADYVKDRFDKL
jgi:hypothetical protein